MVRDALRQSPRIHKNQRRTMLLDEFYQAVVNLIPHFVGRDRTELAGGNFYGEIELALVTDVYDYGIWTPVAGEEMCNLLNRLLRRRKSNARGRPIRQGFQSLERKRQVSAALIVGDGMNFIDDDGFNIAQNRATLFRS